jgi:tRNA (guanine-N7-)-methyltransferase
VQDARQDSRRVTDQRATGPVDHRPDRLGQVRRARPHTGRTHEGRRIREVLSYARRGSRLTDAQASAWQRLADRWWIPEDAVDEPGFDLTAGFGREAPLIVEIGPGIGEATAALAASRPTYNLLAFEVWLPGVAQTMHRLEQAGVDNVRVAGVDAVWALEHLLGPDSISELWTFFPDPWPKTRHRKRRLVTPAFAAVAASRLLPGARWRLATDWPDYAAQMLSVLDAEPLLANEYVGPAPRWSERPLTRFERRGIREGRPITDLVFRRLARTGGTTGTPAYETEQAGQPGRTRPDS